jgi:CRISPR-associated protein Csm2
MSNEQRNFSGQKKFNGQKNFGGQKKFNELKKYEPPKEEINEQNYVDIAEQAIKKLQNDPAELTTTKIRSLLSMTADIYNEILNSQKPELSPEITSRIEYLRVRFIYEAGREEAVNHFVQAAGIMPYLKGINGSRKKFILFNRYMEALVAFHRFYNGKD